MRGVRRAKPELHEVIAYNPTCRWRRLRRSGILSADRLEVHGYVEGSELQRLVGAADRGNREAKEQLFATLYRELHQLARRQLGSMGSAVTISATTLLHEVYLGLAKRETLHFPDRPRFFAYAARAMRSFIIDAARGRHALKRGGAFEITQLDTAVEEGAVDDRALSAVGEALEELASIDTSLAELVDLKYFGGLSLIEIGALRGVSERTMQRDWEKARLFLFNTLNGSVNG